MNREEEKLNAIFSGALEKESPEEREAYLVASCEGNAALRRQLDSLLQAHSEAGDFLRNSAFDPLGKGQSLETPGAVIGRYKLLQQIGEGGFGLVFMAEQLEPVRRMVALKIIKAGMDTREVLARFEAERQALALMDHPNVARVLDGGTTTTGRPFFVMDLVKGVPVTEFCDANELSTTARIELFLQVCAGVQHAHQKGIVHRDLKPTNVLVTVQDGVAMPKIIDFGIAKAIDTRLTDRTLFTRFGQLIGTPAYMSPEQAEWGAPDIDTRSDIYSLGTLLYELLTGTTPFGKETLDRVALDEIRRIVKNFDPPTPSLRLQGLGQQLIEVARKRRIQPGTLSKLLRGDLDWIVMKALEKERARRYATAGELAEDLRRYLAGEVVLARPPSTCYRLGKTVRKHTVAFAAGAIVIGALAGGLGIASWMFFQEREAKREQVHLRALADSRQKQAQAEAAKKQQLLGVLKDMLKGASPEVARGRDTTILREILNKTAAQVPLQLTNQPEVQIEALNTLLDIYDDLQLYARMEAVGRDCVALAKTRLGENNPAFANALGGLGSALLRAGQLEQSEACLRKATALQVKLSGNEASVTRALRRRLGEVLVARKKWSEAETLYRQLLTGASEQKDDTAELLNNLAITLKNQGQLAEAENLQREAVDLGRRGRVENLNRLTELRNLGGQMSESERLAEAESFYRDALEVSRSLWGKDNSKLAPTALSLVDVLSRQKKYTEVEAVFDQLLIGGHQEKAEDAALWAGRADYFARRGLWKQAVTNLCQAIALQPTNSAPFATLALVLASAGEPAAYRLLEPRVLASLPPTSFSLLVPNSVAQRWQTVDDNAAPKGLNGRSMAIVDDRKGRLFAAGYYQAENSDQTAVIRRSADGGRTWATIDIWQPSSWRVANCQGFCSAPDGTLFVVGNLCDRPGNAATINWYVRRSTDGGATWTVQDLVDSGVGGKAQCRGIGVAPGGDIYAAGLTATNQGAGGWVWLVRKSSDGGGTWTTVDSLWDFSTKAARAIGIAPDGAVFVVGMLNGSLHTGNPAVWTVRRSANQGATWTTVDSFQSSPGLASEPHGIAISSTGRIYVAGTSRGKSTERGTWTDHWVVRCSKDGGSTWTISDDLVIDTGNTDDVPALAAPTGITVSPSGEVFVCGYMTGLDHSLRWLVRQGSPSSDNSLRWSTVDNYQMAPAQSARANGISCDSEGNVHVTGRAADALGVEHWITRRFGVIDQRQSRLEQPL